MSAAMAMDYSPVLHPWGEDSRAYCLTV